MVKTGDILENYQGQFAKVVEVTGSRYGMSAWVFKRDKAATETVAVTFLNSYGLEQVLKPREAKKAEAPKVDSKKEAKKAEAPKVDSKKEAKKAEAPKVDSKKEAKKAS